jgi:diguanylate cyclase (GGDEF)-like protein/PAS domain S-box-containing protein
MPQTQGQDKTHPKNWFALLLMLVGFTAAAEPRPLTVGSEIGFPPYADVGVNGEAVGFSVDLFTAVAKVMDLPVEYRVSTWDLAWQGLLDGPLDALPVVARLPEREELLEYTSTHTIGYDSFFVRHGSPNIATFDQARPLKIIVMRADAAHHALVARGFDRQLVLVNTLPEALHLLAAGQHDAVLAPLVQGTLILREQNMLDRIEAGPPLQEYRRDYAFAVRKGNLELRDRLEQGLLIVKGNGEYARIYQQWLGIYEPAVFPVKYLYAGLIILVLLSFVLIVSWDITLRRVLDKRTRELRGSEARFRSYFELPLAGRAITSPSAGWIDVNATLCEMLGYTRAELLQMTWMELTHPDDLAADAAQFQRVMAGEIEGYALEKRFIHRDGHSVYAHIAVHCLRHPDRSVNYFVVQILDITERKQAEEKLQLAASVFSYAREGILITAADGTIVDVNDTFTRITGYSRDEVLGRNPRLLSSGLHNQEFFAAMWCDLVEKGHWYGEIWNRRKEGEVYAEMLTISAVPNAQGQIEKYLGLFSDITALKEHERQLEHIAHYDVLTGLPNRALLADRLQQAMAQAQRRGQCVAVAMLDLDDFKAINDRYGHGAGDQLLITVTARMKQTLREGDTLARLGGDEFVAVLLDLADVEASMPMLTRLLDAAAQPMGIGDLSLQVSVSIGITFYPQAGEIDADQLLRQADQAMYQAKLAGRNSYYAFDAAQDRSIRSYYESLERVHRALVQQEFVLHYQPKVNMRTGAVVGAEALIRWRSAENGLLPPAQFMPMIDASGLASAVGHWVISEALRQMSVWAAQGVRLPVSVNIAARHLQQPEFVAELRALLAMHPDVLPEQLELEILETMALTNVAEVSHLIERCRQLGVGFALDDFGTGYSSLTYLKHLAVQVLKIDQSFVRDLLVDVDAEAIVQGIIGLSVAFRRGVIAEGVETDAHGSRLLQLGCIYAQGYGIARPMPPEQIPAWIAHWTAPRAWTAQ